MKKFYFYQCASRAILQYGLFVLLLVRREFSLPQILFLQAVLLIVKRGAELPVSGIAIRFGRRACLSAGLPLCALVVALTPLTEDFIAFLSLFVILGIALAFICDRVSDTAHSFVEAV